MLVIIALGASYAGGALSTAPTGQKTWYWQNPLPQGNLLYRVDAPDELHAWAVGGPGVVLHSSDGGAQWEPQDPNTLATLRAVDFVDPLTGWVVGDTTTIRKTTDGGSTWTTQTAPAITARGIAMTDTQRGWIVGSTGAIRRTVDGGASWTTSASPTTQQLNDVAAIGEAAWAVGNAGTIIATSDGSSWAAQSSPTTQALNAVSFPTTSTGYVVGAPRTSPAPSQGTVLKTSDGGSTWTTLTVTYQGSTGTTTTLTSTMRAVSFRDANSGWIAGDSGLVLFTSDGGVTWTSQKSGSQAIYGVAAAPGSAGHIVGANGVMLRTATNGESWIGQQQGTTVRLNGASWTGPTSGVVVGAGGLVMTTEDAGDSWASRTLGPNDLYSIRFVDGMAGWLVGSGGFIRKTSNGGSDWFPQASGTTQTLFSVTAFDAMTAWAVGASGTVLKTVDGGATWQVKPSGTTATLYDVFFIDQNRGWAVGTAGTVRSTSDGGETWVAQTSGITTTIFAVQFVDSDTGWFAGATGRARKTVNGGATWTALSTGTTSALYGIEMADANTGWAVGGTSTGSVVLRTTDGGTSWTAQNASFRGIIRQITVATDQVAGLVGDGGAMRRTFDGGATWELTGFWSIANYRSLDFPTSNEGWAVGDGGAIAHTHDGGRSWGAQQAGTTSALYDVYFADQDKGWFVGAGGVIGTTGTHTTWSLQSSGTTQTLRGVAFAGTAVGWAVGGAGTVRATTDGGSTWTTQSAGVDAAVTLYGVSAVDSQTVYAWGGAGTVAKTIDGGSSWTTQTIAGTTLYGGSFPDTQTGWVVGASGLVMRTNDGGSTWTTQTVGTTADLWSIDFLGAQNGSIVGNTGVLRHTVDGGSTWVAQEPGTRNNLYGVHFTDADHGWLVGAGGTILRTTDNAPPTTSLVVDPPAPNGNDNWYVGSPAISFVSNEPGLTYYSWVGPTGPWTTYSVPINPPTDGVLTIYWYSVDPGGNKESVQSMSGKIDATPPSTVSTPSASPIESDTVRVAWLPSSDAASGLDHYRVMLDGSLVGTTTATVMDVGGLQSETRYDFSVIAVDVAGNEAFASPSASAVTLAVDTRPPTGVAARSVPGAGAQIGWSDATGTVGPVTYRVWRSVDGESFSAIATLTGEWPRSLLDTQAPLWRPLRYAVTVLDDRGEGLRSASSTQTTLESVQLAAPRGLTASNTASVLVTWTPLADPGVAGYHVYRSTVSTQTGTTLTVTPVTDASYHDAATAAYTDYWYRVAAVDSSGTLGIRSPAVHIRTEADSATAENPHGAYDTDTHLCAACHSSHRARSGLLLNTDGTDEAPLCLSCHDGTVASDVLSDYTDSSKASRHAVSVGEPTGSLRCGGCHSIHSAGTTESVPAMLRAADKTSGNEYCYVCHGSGTERPRGDMSVFEGSAHAAIAEPPRGTKVVCLSCHLAHSTVEAGLYPYGPDDRCLTCHNSYSTSGGTDIAQRLSGPGPDTRHDLLTADGVQTGARLACDNCHEPHASSSTTPCVDPDEPTTASGMQASDALCLRCHDGTLPTSADTSGWAPAPLAEGGATIMPNIATYWATDTHGSGSSSSPSLRASMGYSAGDTLECSDCHDSHGSQNRFALKESVVASGSPTTADSLIVVPVGTDGADFRLFCDSCHEDVATTHPSVAEGGADLTQWPIDCAASGCHTHAGSGL